MAAIVLEPESHIEPAEVSVFCESRLARYKVPKKVKIVKELPRNASNKLVRRELVKLFINSEY